MIFDWGCTRVSRCDYLVPHPSNLKKCERKKTEPSQYSPSPTTTTAHEMRCTLRQNLKDIAQMAMVGRPTDKQVCGAEL